MRSWTVTGAAAAIAFATASNGDEASDQETEYGLLFMSHPFHEGFLGLWSEAGLLAPGPTISRLPGIASSRSQWLRGVRACELASPVTVAGPRRIHTGFPWPPTPISISAAVYPPVEAHPAILVTVNLTRIYTKLGDGGETHLGDMSRVSKNDPRIEAYGTIDELNALIGLALATADARRADGRRASSTSRTTCSISAPTCRCRRPTSASGCASCPSRPRGSRRRATRSTRRSQPLHSFVLPGGTPLAAALHVCRTVCRRAERRALMVADANPEVVRYLNRLSDLLFILARAANGTAEPLWEPGASRDA